MAGQAAYTKKIKVSADGSTNWLDLPATSPSLEVGGDLIDDVELATNQGYRTRIQGLHDFSVSAECNYSAGNPAIALCINAKLNRTPIFIDYLPSGTGASYKGQTVVESFSHAGDVSDKETISFQFQGDGALTYTPPA